MRNMRMVLLIFPFFIFGCGDYFNGSRFFKKPPTIKINPLPLVKNAIDARANMLITLENEEDAKKVCDVAYGVLTMSELKKDLESRANLSTDNKSKDYLVKFAKIESIKSYQILCGSYMIKSLSLIPDVNRYLIHGIDSKGNKSISADNSAVVNLMPLRLAIARATAELYARIIYNLNDKDLYTISEYEDEIQLLFEGLVSDYLNHIDSYHKDALRNKYQLILLKDGVFKFKSIDDYLLDVDSDGVALYWHGTPWLSNTYLLGSVQSLPLNSFY